MTSSGRIENSGRIATTADGTEASPTYLSIETTEKGAAGTFISNGGRIESKGLLVIETGEDISLRNGAVVQNNGSRPATTVLNAGHNLVIESKTNVNNAKGSANLSVEAVVLRSMMLLFKRAVPCTAPPKAILNWVKIPVLLLKT